LYHATINLAVKIYHVSSKNETSCFSSKEHLPGKLAKVGTIKSANDKENVTNFAQGDDSDDDDDKVTVESPSKSLNITPPGSPNSSLSKTPCNGGKRPRAVRGANRTRKTEQALKRILVRGQQKLHEEEEELPPTKRRRAGRHKNSCERGEDKEKGAVCQSLGTSPPAINNTTGSSDSFNVKIRLRGEIRRLSVTPADRLGQLADRLAASEGLPAGRIIFESGGERLGRDVTVGLAGLSIASILQAR
jgi:hypothetical protein